MSSSPKSILAVAFAKGGEYSMLEVMDSGFIKFFFPQMQQRVMEGIEDWPFARPFRHSVKHIKTGVKKRAT